MKPPLPENDDAARIVVRPQRSAGGAHCAEKEWRRSLAMLREYSSASPQRSHHPVRSERAP